MLSQPARGSPGGGAGVSAAEDSELADLALTIAREAADLLIDGAAEAAAVATKSSAHDVVTQKDRDSEALIRRRIAQARPGDQVLGEEEGTIGEASDVRWVVDPLDGTVNYLYGIPSWAVSIGIERDGVPCAGVVVAPALDEQYIGISGQGSWVVTGTGERHPLAVSGLTGLQDALVGTGFGYVRERREHQGRVLAGLVPQVRDIRRVGAAAVDLCWVARGRLDAHYERGLQPWDRSAGALIAAEAGAVVAGLPGAPATTDLTIVSTPGIYTPLATALGALGVLDGP